MKARRRAMIGLLVLLVSLGATAQEQESVPNDPPPLQRGFSSIRLGMSFQATQAALQVDQAFRYRGEPDIRFLPSTEIPLIEAEGRAFLARAVFQFRGDELYVITLTLDRDRLDYFSVYRSLVDQYGEPDALDPGRSLWERGDTRLTLERPLSVKYMDVPTLDRIIEEGQIEEALDELTRDRFLEQL